MVGLIFWGAISIGIIALFFVLAYHSARIQDGNVSAAPEWVLEVGAAIVAGAIGIGFAITKFGPSLSKLTSSWTLLFIIVAATVAGGMAIFYVAAGTQETKICKLNQQLADEHAAVIAKEVNMNEKFIKEILEEDLSDIEIEELEPVAHPSLNDERLRKIFERLSGAELSHL